MDGPSKYLTTAELADRYHISTKTLYRWERDEKLSFPKSIKLNGRNLYPVEQIQEWERRRAGASRGRAA